MMPVMTHPKRNDMTRRSIDVPGLHHGSAPIPQASLVGRLLASSGINGMDPETGEVPPSLEEQVRLIFANIERIMAVAGAQTDDIARCVFYVRDRASRTAIDGEWTRMFPDPSARPARHTLRYDLADPLLVQCELTAYLEKDPA
jgi:2-iminobutanoate/2-iminopropanoate deaminase